MHDVRLGDFYTDGHRIELAENDDGRGGLHGIHCLSLLGDDCQHSAIDGCGDAGIAEIDTRGFDRHVSLHDLGVELRDLGPYRLHRCLS